MINKRQKSSALKSYQDFLIILSVLLIPVLTSCGQKQHKDEVAVVNGSPVSLQEFQRELAIYANRNPDFKLNAKSVEEHLNMVIDKQLMIQEAMKMGLAEDKRFLETIKSFWEQTLIRELIEVRSREWSGKLIVTEDEILAYYQNMKTGLNPRPLLKDVREEIRLLLFEQKKQKAMDEWLKEARNSAEIKIDMKKLSESYK
ncbi:MAG: SurA N-terminal domain-containing protein [Nitrospirae bacterium]|nr:SurA N-terminal domain-containing protein [Nitrospirota bacterium]